MAEALNLSWITDTLAVGGRFPEPAAEALARTQGVAAVVDLRVEACDDVELLCRHGMAFLHLPTVDMCGVSRAMLDDGVAFTRQRLTRGERVLIHCEHGIGRSAVLALCVLVAGGMPPLSALQAAKARRGVISPSPAQYEAWVDWLQAWRAAGRVEWDIPDFHTFGCIAYAHLARQVG